MDLPFETLLKLEAEMGSKTFREANSDREVKTKEHKKIKLHDNEAPEEFSSKGMSKRSSYVPRAQRPRSIDPRFDSRSGRFKEHHFKKNFQFAFDLRDGELEKLKNSSATRENHEEQEKAKYLIQRMENQKREELRKNQRNSHITTRTGSKYFPSKKEQLAQGLVEKYQELKESGKLEKHLEKRRKKQAGKERKKMNIEKN